MVAHSEFVYKPAARVTFKSLPPGIRWYYLEAPPDLQQTAAGIPVSEFAHGIIATHVELDVVARNKAQLEPYDVSSA